MVDTFHEYIRRSIANEDLQIALDANAQRRVDAREVAFSSLPGELSEYRQRAKKIRQDVVDNLDQYLEQFTQNAASNGIQIHTAATAAQAVEHVQAIGRAAGVQLIAKSKTMVSEEIELNQALEATGNRVVETDLGEYIIQLRGEPPAHIITPAVHLRKEQVDATFLDKLGINCYDDIGTMTAVARGELRQVFLEADLGISGVNFGVAESGSLCLVTNEGNGRMVTTLPRIHIALMGIERLVPNMEDLALMLELLPRSATGQKITVYTTIINSPRKAGDPDGPEERHLILVDNGRRAMKASPLAEGLLCIRCGACLNACPVFGEIGGHAYVNDRGEASTYPGPIGSIVSPGLFGQEQFGKFARASTLCGACKDACPVDIDLPKLLLRVRAGGATINSKQVKRSIPKHVNLGLKLYTWIAEDAKRFSMGLKLAGLLSKIVSPKADWLKLPAFTGWGYSKDLPRPSEKPFRDRWGAVNAQNKSIPEQIKKTPLSEPVNFTQGQNVDDKVERFSRELTALSGLFTLCQPGQLADQILKHLHELEITSILAWDDNRLPDGLIENLRSNGINVSTELDADVKAGLSGADAAIAETGSLVISLEEGKPQFVSLLPDYHFAVINSGDITDTIYQVISSNKIKQASMTTIVSGPSRTADIEMTLTIGVHGPRQVHVFCLQD